MWQILLFRDELKYEITEAKFLKASLRLFVFRHEIIISSDFVIDGMITDSSQSYYRYVDVTLHGVSGN